MVHEGSNLATGLSSNFETSHSSPSAGEFKLRMRKDLICVPRMIAGRSHLVIKDPIRMSYHYYLEEDFFLLKSLDSSAPFSKIRAEYESRYGSPASDLRVKHLVSAAIRDRLGFSNLPGQGSELYRQQKKRPLVKLIRILTNPLAIKFPGLDLSRVFDALVPYTMWIIKPSFVTGIGIAALAAILLVLFNLTQFQQKLPLASEFFAARNILYLMFVLGLTKIFHEFGHALACRQLGAECHQVGLMFLVFTPCLYCDVTDAWMINDKWRRIFISSAGMFAELGLASICTLLWWASEPGFFNNLCLNVMFVCSVGTVLFNGNPLLRYDGYYILSDLADIPNLWSKSRNALRSLSDRVFFGLPITGRHPTSWRRFCFMVVYGISSIGYRLVVVVAILFFIMSFLKSYHLFQLSLFFAGFVLLGAFVTPVVNEFKRTLLMVNQRKITSFRLTVVWFSVGLVFFLIFTLPIPYRISIPAYIELENCERIYVTTPGILTETVSAGVRVQKDQRIAILDNPDLRTEASIVRGQLEQTRSRLRSLETLRTVDANYGARIPTEQEHVEALENRLERLQKRINNLQLSSSRSGVVTAARDQQNTQSNQHELGTWAGSPLDPQNQNAFLEKGTLFCLVGDPSLSKGFALVQQSIVDLIEPGQSVKIQIGNSPQRKISGEIIQLSPLEDIELPPDLRSLITSRFGQDLQVNQIEFGTMYLATIHLERPEFPLLNFESAKARVSVAPRSLGFRMVRYLKRTFIFLSD